jgi:hypothetical protein
MASYKNNKKSVGLKGGPNEYLTHISDLFSVEGYKADSPDVNNPYNIINSGNITMEGVDFPVIGTDNLGNEKLMTPGNNYQFPGDQVFEVPLRSKQVGGSLPRYQGDKGASETSYNPIQRFKNNLAENLYPYNYDNSISQVWDAGVLGNPSAFRDPSMSDNQDYGGYQEGEDSYRDERIDLLHMLMGKEQITNSIEESIYKPTDSENKDAKYYRSKTTERDIVMDLYQANGSAYPPYEGDTTTLIDLINKIPSEKGKSKHVHNNILNTYQLSRGEDKKGSYIAYYDEWDVNPFKKYNKTLGDLSDFVTEDILKLTPPEIYGRIYYDKKTGEFLNTEELNKKQYGGDLPKEFFKKLDKSTLDQDVNWYNSTGNTQFLPTAQEGLESDIEYPVLHRDTRKHPYGNPKWRNFRSSLGLKGMNKNQRERYTEDKDDIAEWNNRPIPELTSEERSHQRDLDTEERLHRKALERILPMGMFVDEYVNDLKLRQEPSYIEELDRLNRLEYSEYYRKLDAEKAAKAEAEKNQKRYGGDLPEAQVGTFLKSVLKQAPKYADDALKYIDDAAKYVDDYLSNSTTPLIDELLSTARTENIMGPRVVDVTGDSGKSLGYRLGTLPPKRLLKSIHHTGEDLSGNMVNELFPNGLFHGSPKVFDTPIIDNITELKTNQVGKKNSIPGFYATPDPRYSRVYMAWLDNKQTVGGAQGALKKIKEAGTNTQLYNFKLKPDAKVFNFNEDAKHSINDGYWISDLTPAARKKLVEEGYDAVLGMSMGGKSELIMLSDRSIVDFTRMSENAYNIDNAFYGRPRPNNVTNTNPPVHRNSYTGVSSIDDINVQDLLDKGLITNEQYGGEQLPEAQLGAFLRSAVKQAPKFIDDAAKYLDDAAKYVDNYFNPPKKSLRNWIDVNESILDNKILLQEYQLIEETTKANGTWMKNADGSAFQGTPELFIQSKSKNFQNSYPEGITEVWRGMEEPSSNLLNDVNLSVVDGDGSKMITGTGAFTGNEDLAKRYIGTNENSPLYQLAMRNSDNSIEIPGLGSDWLNITNPYMKKKESLIRELQLNIKALENARLAKAHGNTQYTDYFFYNADKRNKELANVILNYDDVVANKNYVELAKWWDNPKTRVGGTYSDEVNKILGYTERDVSTDDLGIYLQQTGLDNLRIPNIMDGGRGNVYINNQVPGNYLKSLTNNNGMFDLSRPSQFEKDGGESLPEAQLGAFFRSAARQVPKLADDAARYIDDGVKWLDNWLSGTTDNIVKEADEVITPSWAKGVTHYGTSLDGIENALVGMKQRGKYLDDVNYDASSLIGENVVNHGTHIGRQVVEVALPDGNTQLFYKSSGLAGKKGSGASGTTEGLWQPFGGHAAIAKTDKWFIKDAGYKNYYDSKSFRDISGNLDRIVEEQGWDMSNQLLKGDLKYGGDIPEAQVGAFFKTVAKKAPKYMDDAAKWVDNFIHGTDDAIKKADAIETFKPMLNSSIENQKAWINSEEYIIRKQAATGLSREQIIKDGNKIIKKLDEVNFDVDFAGGLSKTPAFYLPDGNLIKLDADEPFVEGIIDHEVKHAGSEIAILELFPRLRKRGYLNYPTLETGSRYLNKPQEQQVRFQKMMESIEADQGIKKGTPLTLENLQTYVDKVKKSPSYLRNISGEESGPYPNYDVDSMLGQMRITHGPDYLKKLLPVINKAWLALPAAGVGTVLANQKYGGSLPKAQFGAFNDWLSSGADYVVDAYEDVSDTVEDAYNSVADTAGDVLTDVQTSVNPYNYRRTDNSNNPLDAFMSGDFEKYPTYYEDNKDEAFSKARADLGPGEMFLYDGIRYKTDHAGETTHEGSNNFLKKMEIAVEKGEIKADVFDRFKEVWTELGQPDLEVGVDKYDNLFTAHSWDDLNLDNTDHVNSLTDKLFIKYGYNADAESHMDKIINELTHVQQQREMGRVPYMTTYVQDLGSAFLETGVAGDFNIDDAQNNLYNKDGTLENDAHRSDHNLNNVLSNYIHHNIRRSDMTADEYEEAVRLLNVKPMGFTKKQYGGSSNFTEQTRMREGSYNKGREHILDPRFKNAQDGKEITTWGDYINPMNWGVTDRDDDGTFDQAFEAARKANEEEFMWYGTRYNTNREGEENLYKGLNKVSTQRRKNLKDAIDTVVSSQGNDDNLEALLTMTAFMENTYGGDKTAYGRSYTRGPMSIDDIAFNDLTEPRGEKSTENLTGLVQNQKNTNMWLSSLGILDAQQDSSITSTDLDTILRSDNALAGVAAARAQYGRVSAPLPDRNDYTAMYNYYMDHYNRTDADHSVRFKRGYDKFILPKEKNGGERKANKHVISSKNTLVDKPVKLKKGGETESNAMYKDYVNGTYSGHEMEYKAEKNYDKLNRLHYNDAKTKGMSVSNYILTHIID